MASTHFSKQPLTVGWWLVATFLAGMLALAPPRSSAQGGEPRILATTTDDPITPVIDASMRDIVPDILGSEVPVIVYVSPQGARAASAGAIITFASHVAAMAPGTSIGAAIPVAGDTGEDLEQKAINEAVA